MMLAAGCSRYRVGIASIVGIGLGMIGGGPGRRQEVIRGSRRLNRGGGRRNAAAVPPCGTFRYVR